MRVVSIDPSGNHGNEGMGTTGIALLENGKPTKLLEIKAKDFIREDAYWLAHVSVINYLKPDYVVMEGYRLYHHKGMKADTQANSELQTSQLIGAIKVFCYEKNLPLYIQFANEVKSRWSDKVLSAKGYVEQKGNRYYFDGQVTSNHKRDALRHGLHFWRYKINDLIH